MWMIDNDTAYGSERNWVRDKNGLHLWIVAVKATFDVSSDGSVKLADEQTPPVLAPEYFGEPGRSSLKYDSDLLVPKNGTDVLVQGCAHAPRGQLASRVPVRMRVGAIDKTLVVHGDRRYYKSVSGLGMTSPLPFDAKPIQYELAFGGSDLEDPDPRKRRHDSRNPIGRGVASSPERLDGQLAHSIEYGKGDPSKLGPAGFGPIDSFWSPRLERAGTFDEAWERSRKPLLPVDYDEGFSRCAPADQMPEAPLRGGEPVELTNLTPEGVLRLELPRIYLAFTTRVAGRREEHRAILASVILEPEEKKLSMVWQTALPVKQRDSEYLDQTTIREKSYVS